MGTTTEIKERLPWVPLILLIGFTSIIGSAIYFLLGPLSSLIQCSYNWGISATGVAVLPAILIILAYPFRKLLKTNAALLTYLFTAGTSICYSNFAGREASYLFPVGMAKTQLYTEASIRNLMGAWWWVPSSDVVQATMGGGIAVDWALWAGPILFWTALNFSLFVFSSGISLILRRRWLDIERIPFPQTLAVHEIIKVVDVNRVKGMSLRPFIFGLILGIFFQIPTFLQAIFPWFPDIFGWRSNTCPGGLWNPCPDSFPLMQNIVGLTTMSKSPILFGFYFLAPLSVSFNVWFWTLIMMVLEQVAYQMGYYSGILTESATCRLMGYGGMASIGQGPPFYWYYISQIGGFTAIAAIMLYNSRSYLRQTFKEALRTGSSMPPEEVKAEATSYRTAYLFLGVGTIVVLLWHMAAGIDFLSALSILIFTIFISGIAGFYTYAQAGFLLGGRGAHSWFPLLIRFGGTVPGMDSNTLMSGFMTQLYTNTSVQMYIPVAQMESFRMASLTGTSNRNTFLVIIVAVLISTPLILITKVWLVSLYGAKVFSYSACGIDTVCSGWMWMGSLPLLGTYGALGFVITITLSILHSRFVWFPFEPLGFVIATSMGGTWTGAWTVYLAAWVLKTIILRVGGSKLYEQYGIPTVGGFVAGIVLTLFMGSLVGVYKFYVPF